jgi:hypothetical protein
MIVGKKGTKELFVQDARNIHGDKYDYSMVVYENNHTKVDIICPTHGVFQITPMSHLQGQGCKFCAKDQRTKLIYGFRINDLYEESHSEAFSKWYNMIRRCYDNKYHKGKPSYEKATVCDEWKYFSQFKEWFDSNYISGYHLDKDILCKGNKEYSPDKCCFVPNEINVMLTKSEKIRGGLPIGVRLSKSKKKFEARLSIYRGYIHLGTYLSVEEAFLAYKQAKENWIKDSAVKYFTNNLITKRVYEALLNYKVSITD